MRSRSLAGLLAGSLLMAVSCSGDDDVSAPSASEPPASTTAPPTTTLPSTTVEPTTTVELTTTAAETTTTRPESTVPPTSEAPITTLPEGIPPRVTFPDDPEKQAVVDAAYAFFDAARAAQAAPADDAHRNAVVESMSDPLLSRMTLFLDRLVADGLRIVGSSSSPTYLEVFPPSVLIAGTSATFDACVVDSDTQITVADGAVVDDDVVSSSQSYSLTLIGEAWQVRDFTVYETWEDKVGCG